jgi:hypothetical protein
MWRNRHRCNPPGAFPVGAVLFVVFPNSRWTYFEIPLASYRKNHPVANSIDQTRTPPMCPMWAVRIRRDHHVGQLFFFIRAELLIERVKRFFQNRIVVIQKISDIINGQSEWHFFLSCAILETTPYQFDGMIQCDGVL